MKIPFSTLFTNKNLSGAERKTYIHDSIRSIPDGFVIAYAHTFFLLVAITFFNTGDVSKSLISASGFIGFFLAIFSGYVFRGFKKSTAAALLTFLGGICVIITGIAGSAWIYVAGVVLCGVLLNMRPPLFTSIYQENYNTAHLGKLFSTAILLSTISTLIASIVVGFLLDKNIGYFRIPFVVVGLLLISVAWLVFSIPSTRLKKKQSLAVFSDLSLLFKNKLFGIISLSWFLIGFANLWTIPLRVVYLAEPDRGLGLSPLTVSIILGIIPPLTRIITNKIWAGLFDKILLIYYRILVNLFIGTGILLFFITENLVVINIGNILINIGFAGSPFIWNLWVNKIAPEGESHRYMSVHTFLAGVRGIIGPFAGFYFIQYFSIAAVGYTSAFMILVSIVLIIPLISEFQSARSSG